MDHPQNLNTVEWFFGYGGNHLGLKRVIPNLRLVAACEIEAYALANMVAKMEAGALDPAPIWSDCKTFPAEPFQDRVDLFIASYPCQGFSSAGKRLGSDDPRYLWPWVLRFIRDARPRYCFLENVEGHVSLGLSTVLSDLEEAGYRKTWGIFSAAECGAPHPRKRVFILADCASFGSPEPLPHPGHGRPDSVGRSTQELAHSERFGSAPPGTQSLAPGQSGESRFANQELDDAGGSESGRLPGRERQEISPPRIASESFFWPGFVSRLGQPQADWEPPRILKTIGGLGGGAHGRASNVDRLRLLGNGVYPATAARAFVTLYRELRGLGESIDHTHTHTHTHTGKIIIGPPPACATKRAQTDPST